MSIQSEHVVLENQGKFYDLVVRSIEKSDKLLERDFIESLSEETKHYRFLGSVNNLSDTELQKLCDVDQHNSMAFIAIVTANGKQREIGIARYARDAKGNNSEMALTIADEFKDTELSTILMDRLIEHAQKEGVSSLYSIEFRDNKSMRNLANSYQMKEIPEPGDRSEVRFVLDL